MYHEIMDMPAGGNKFRHPRSPYYISRLQFEEHVKYLYDQGFKTVTIRELIEIKNNKHRGHFKDKNKLVAITFDDGYFGNYQYALPILKKFQFKTTFFVIVNRIATSQFMSWEQLKELTNIGMEVQSHTITHRPLEILSSKEIRVELHNSKQILEEHLMQPICYLSYPHGSYDSRVLDMAERIGYLGSCTSEWGYFMLFSDPYQIERIVIRKDCGISDFTKIIQRDKKFIRKAKAVAFLKRRIKNFVGIKNYMRIYDKVIGSTQSLEL